MPFSAPQSQAPYRPSKKPPTLLTFFKIFFSPSLLLNYSPFPPRIPSPMQNRLPVVALMVKFLKGYYLIFEEVNFLNRRMVILIYGYLVVFSLLFLKVISTFQLFNFSTFQLFNFSTFQLFNFSIIS